MGRGSGRRKHFTGKHITDPAEAARKMSREGFRKRVLPSGVIVAENAGFLGRDDDWVVSPSIRVGSIN